MKQESSGTAPSSSYEEPYRYTDDERRSSFDAEDDRWKSQVRDWVVLGLMVLISLGYHLIIFTLQPGLR